jgi:hypothetical protein
LRLYGSFSLDFQRVHLTAIQGCTVIINPVWIALFNLGGPVNE